MDVRSVNKDVKCAKFEVSEDICISVGWVDDTVVGSGFDSADGIRFVIGD